MTRTMPKRKASVAPMTEAVIMLESSLAITDRRPSSILEAPSANMSNAPSAAPIDASSMTQRSERTKWSMGPPNAGRTSAGSRVVGSVRSRSATEIASAPLACHPPSLVFIAFRACSAAPGRSGGKRFRRLQRSTHRQIEDLAQHTTLAAVGRAHVENESEGAAEIGHLGAPLLAGLDPGGPVEDERPGDWENSPPRPTTLSMVGSPGRE